MGSPFTRSNTTAPIRWGGRTPKLQHLPLLQRDTASHLLSPQLTALTYRMWPFPLPSGTPRVFYQAILRDCRLSLHARTAPVSLALAPKHSCISVPACHFCLLLAPHRLETYHCYQLAWQSGIFRNSSHGQISEQG